MPKRRLWADNIEAVGAAGGPGPWMLELARMLILKDLPMGVIVGSAVIDRVTEPDDGLWAWHLTLGGVEGADVQRAKRLRKPTGHPQPVWFEPFLRVG